MMTTAEAGLFMDAAGLEFDALCAKIVTDGRDPSIVAFAMKQALGRRLRELQSLWDNRLTANTRIADTGGANEDIDNDARSTPGPGRQALG